MSDLPVTAANVRYAAAAIADAIAHTPVIAAPALSELAATEIHLKLETLHRTGSFKERGALNKLLTLHPDERRAGVVAMSAGNHAQGVAYHAQRLGIPATVVMPEGTPFTKIDRTEAFGARVLLKGDSLSTARQAADALAREQGLHEPFHDRLMDAYWSEATNIGDADELRRLAAEVGLDVDDVEHVIADPEAYLDLVEGSTRQAHSIVVWSDYI